MNLVQKQKQDMKQAVNQVQKELPPMTGTEGALARAAMKNAVNEVEDDMEEQTSAGSAGAFVAPMGWDPEDSMSKSLNEEDELDEINVGAYSQPAIWAKNKKGIFIDNEFIDLMGLDNDPTALRQIYYEQLKKRLLLAKNHIAKLGFIEQESESEPPKNDYSQYEIPTSLPRK